ncbi:glycosyltransferase [Streptomyces sp. NPDC056161]|uniref:glycosyltransferase family 4 protein n=1 Tax=Streptomyces sp. NPDC056161 TaxID=3345732 RepID=UPI0035DFDB98
MHHSATDPRFRVLHLAQPADGGVARVVLDLTRAQLAAGLRVTVGCPGGELAAGARELGADVRHWRATRSPGPGLAGEVHRLDRLVARVRPDLVHAHSAKAGLAGRLAVRGRIPTVFQPHAWSFEAVDGVTAALALKWERWGARWATRVLCVSEAERATGARAGIRARWSVIPNGVDPLRFSPEPPGTAAAPPAAAPQAAAATAPALEPGSPHPHRPPTAGHAPDTPTPDTPAADTPPAPDTPAADTPTPDTPGSDTPGSVLATAPAPATDPATPLVVCVGRLCPQKGQDVLLRAWDGVVRQVPGARLVLVGDGPDRERLRTGAPPSVAFAGAVADAAPWYRAADLVVLPSRWEGMALAPLEAMACGRPVLLTDVDGARECLPPGLAAHCLVPPGNPVALAGALAALLLDPALRTALGPRGRRHVLTTHDVRHTTEAVTDLYRELLGAAPAVPSQCRESSRP